MLSVFRIGNFFWQQSPGNQSGSKIIAFNIKCHQLHEQRGKVCTGTTQGDEYVLAQQPSLDLGSLRKTVRNVTQR